MHSTSSSLRTLAVLAVSAAVPISVLAQDDDQSGWNHFGLDFRMGFNIRAKFMNAGVLAAPAAPSAGSAVNRKYSDGFVNVDSSHNTGSQTWNWGYQNAGQVSGDSLQMHATAVSPGASSSATGDPNLGFEASFVRDLGHESWGRWGLKAAFGFTTIDLGSSGAMGANAQFITDTYPLHGIKPPIAPYRGSFNGPGTVIGSVPTRSIVTGDASVIGSRSLDATLYDLRLGPTVDLDIFKCLSLQLGGGLALGVADSTFSYSETSTAAGSVSASGSTHDTGFLVGGYAEAELAWHFCRSASVFGGVGFEYLGDFQQSASGRAAQLDLSQAVFCKVGLQWRF